MKATLLALALLLAAHDACAAPCAEKRWRDISFVELSVPEGARRPAGAEEFSFINHETTLEQLVEKVGPPDAAQGTRVSSFIWCFADGTELLVTSRDGALIDSVRHEGREIYKRAKKKS